MKFYFFIFLFFLIIIFFCLKFVSAAHYIAGYVNDAMDGTLANDHIIVLWNPVIGFNDNITDIIGPNGNSGANNIYMIDCEMLNTSCKIGDNMSLQVVNNGDNHITRIVNVTVTGAGYDVSPNLTLNSPMNITSIVVDDSITIPENEIDLIAASTRTVTCQAIIEMFDGNSIKNATAEFFDDSISFFGDSDHNNNHYSNNSCYVNPSYGANQSQVLCNFNVWHYANSQNWRCILRVEDNLSIASNKSDLTFINPLLSIGLISSVDYGFLGLGTVSNETILNVTNYGNVRINITLSGYAVSEDDGYAMNCSSGKNISIYYEKFNLTASNPGSLDLTQFESYYSNVTSNPVIKRFNLDYRKSDSVNDAINKTYWRIFAPPEISGTCSGNIVFGAVRAAEV